MDNKLKSNYKTLYWLFTQFGGTSHKWESLSHNGVLFPPEYEQHKIPVKYKDNDVVLPPLAEEYATLYAKYLDTEYVKNKTFNKNFWKDWSKTLKETGIDSLEECDFSKINRHILNEKLKKTEMSKEDKEKMITERKEEEKVYTKAVVNGKEQPVGNFRMEPPGIFLGRGCHPKLGRIKRRIYPEDIVLNIGRDSKIPEALPGHKWKKVIHDKSVEWLASWKDELTNKVKYVWLGAHSEMKGKSDMQKFDRSRRLRKKVKQIREENVKNMSSSNIKEKQIATALYFIDNFALRAGNEKGDDQADTVGVTSLRIEHIKLLENKTILLDFLGKDSVRYKNKVAVTQQVYDNVTEFAQGKDKFAMLFDNITPNDVNKYLQSFMKDLTSKVFRTFNASYTFYKELHKVNKKMDDYDGTDKINLLLDMFNKANAKVAILCNHQKNVSKSFTSQIDKINQQIAEEKKKYKNKSVKSATKKKIKDKIKKLKEKKKLRTELKDISLGTSKTNYIDPRITVSFMKRHNIPIEKLFNKSLQDKFKWAIDGIDKDWKY